MPSERQLATLVAFANIFTITAQDDLLELFDRLMAEFLAKSQQEGKRSRLRTIRDLDNAARQLREACAILLNDQTPDAELRATIFARISPSALTESIQTVDALTRRPDENLYYAQLFSHYNGLRRFLPQMFPMIDFEANPAAQPVLSAWQFLRDYESTKKIPWEQAPITGMTASWRKVIYDGNGQIQQRPIHSGYSFASMKLCVDTMCSLLRASDTMTREHNFSEGGLVKRFGHKFYVR